MASQDNRKAKPLRIAIVLDRQKFACRPISRPFSLEGYPPVEIQLFAKAPGGQEEQLVGALPELKSQDFDLILDGPSLFPGTAGQENLVSGPPARLLRQLVCCLLELRQKQEISVGILNQASDAIVTINEDHVIVGYNDGAEKIFGYSRAEALGQDLKLLIPPPHKEVHREYVRRYVATRQARVIGGHVRLTAQRRDGSEFPMSISFSVAEILGNLYFTGIIRDITEYKDMEDRLLQSERLAAIGNTVTHIAHEIKNPLLIIGGFARQLEHAPGLDDKSRQKLGIMAEEVGHLEAMVAEMRDFVRPPAAKKTPGDIESLLNETLEFFADTLEEHHIEVRRVPPEEPRPEVSFDRQQIRQVLINLFKNALEAMPRGGTLTISTRVKEGNLEIGITDTGEGMAPEVAANVFQPYFSTKETGTGLGLAICQFIVKEQHGGCINLESTRGQGSTFTIQLPLGDVQPLGT
jgi:two-component system sensor kinase FixL